MHPVLFEIGPFTIASYGAMLAVAFLAATWLLRREFARTGIGEHHASSITLAAVLGGIIGARIYFIFEHQTDFLSNPIGMIFTGSGLTWYGGFIGGFVAVLWSVRKIPARNLVLVDLISPLILFGYGIGRIGCLLAGDGDYGPPTDLPWGMAFPKGFVPTDVPVHPTPIYESVLSLALFFVLWKLRKRNRVPGLMLGGLLVFYGFERFVTEFWRLTPKVLWGWMSTAQIISLAVMAGGMLWGYRMIKRAESSPSSLDDEERK